MERSCCPKSVDFQPVPRAAPLSSVGVVTRSQIHNPALFYFVYRKKNIIKKNSDFKYRILNKNSSVIPTIGDYYLCYVRNLLRLQNNDTRIVFISVLRCKSAWRSRTKYCVYFQRIDDYFATSDKCVTRFYRFSEEFSRNWLSGWINKLNLIRNTFSFDVFDVNIIEFTYVWDMYVWWILYF